MKTHVRHLRNHRPGREPDRGKSVAFDAFPLERREPDEKGWLIQPGAAPQRSPHIIDLTEKGRQPMTDKELGLSVVYSGKIYNYRELKRNLDDPGIPVFLRQRHRSASEGLPRLGGCLCHPSFGDVRLLPL